MNRVFSFLLWPKREARGPSKQGRKKRGSITCRTDRANEANKMFIIWLCWLFRVWIGDRELKVRTATYGPGIDQSQHAKSVSHIIKIITNTEIRVHGYLLTATCTCTCILKVGMAYSGADPGFSEGRGGGSDKCPPTLSYCYCCLTSPFSHKKKYLIMVKYFHLFHFGGSTEPLKPPLHPHQHTSNHYAQLPVRVIL